MNDQNNDLLFLVMYPLRGVVNCRLASSIFYSWCSSHHSPNTSQDTPNNEKFCIGRSFEERKEILIEGNGSECIGVEVCRNSRKWCFGSRLKTGSTSSICNEDIDFLNTPCFQTFSQCLMSIFDVRSRDW